VRSEDLFKVRGLGAVVTGAASGIGLACGATLGTAD
jgi:NAD(P)-dependent dehydrogenase (short-subunit alcohol dehydrogenase family)